MTRRTPINGNREVVKNSKDDPFRPLTIKQQRFVDFYDGNGVDAARKAGYKGDDAGLAIVATQNIRKLNVRRVLKEREDKRNNPHIATREERQAFWTRVFRGEELYAVVVGVGADARLEMIGSKMPDRLKASELLGRSEADFVDTTKLTGPNGGPIQVQLVPIDFSDFSDNELAVMERLGFPKGENEHGIR